jgi:hypothetical protein
MRPAFASLNTVMRDTASSRRVHPRGESMTVLLDAIRERGCRAGYVKLRDVFPEAATRRISPKSTSTHLHSAPPRTPSTTQRTPLMDTNDLSRDELTGARAEDDLI